MGWLLTSIGRAFSSIGNLWGWIGPGGILTAVFTALGSYIEPLAELGWAAIVLASVLMASLVLIAGSLVVLAWQRASGGALKAKDETAVQPAGHDTAEIAGTVSNRPPFNPKGFYIGEIRIVAAPLKRGEPADISIYIFNGTNRDIHFGLDGHIRMSKKGEGKQQDIRLPSPSLHSIRDTLIPANQEREIKLKQQINKSDANLISDASNGYKFGFDFIKLEVVITADGESPVRVPVDRDISLRRSADAMWGIRSTVVRASAASIML